MKKINKQEIAHLFKANEFKFTTYNRETKKLNPEQVILWWIETKNNTRLQVWTKGNKKKSIKIKETNTPLTYTIQKSQIKTGNTTILNSFLKNNDTKNKSYHSRVQHILTTILNK